MPNFESSELGRAGLEALAAGRVDLLARRLAGASECGRPGEEELRKVSRDFASVFYSLAFREMQQSVRLAGEDEEEGNPVTQGTEDFVGMFMPQAVAGNSDDPLARYIYDSLKEFYGGLLDENA